jgi:hypothetical protein
MVRCPLRYRRRDSGVVASDTVAHELEGSIEIALADEVRITVRGWGAPKVLRTVLWRYYLHHFRAADSRRSPLPSAKGWTAQRW